MLREVGEGIKTAISSLFNQVEFYDGQFEKFDEEIVNPPACYIDYQSGEPSATKDPLGSIDLTLYLMSSSLVRDPGSMLDLVESVYEVLHDKAILGDSNEYIGRAFYKGFKNNTTFPGFIIWDVLIQVQRG